jgi:hypothetical protein
LKYGLLADGTQAPANAVAWPDAKLASDLVGDLTDVAPTYTLV